MVTLFRHLDRHHLHTYLQVGYRRRDASGCCRNGGAFSQATEPVTHSNWITLVASKIIAELLACGPCLLAFCEWHASSFGQPFLFLKHCPLFAVRCCLCQRVAVKSGRLSRVLSRAFLLTPPCQILSQYVRVHVLQSATKVSTDGRKNGALDFSTEVSRHASSATVPSLRRKSKSWLMRTFTAAKVTAWL
jgi:hypothetical protein